VSEATRLSLCAKFGILLSRNERGTTSSNSSIIFGACSDILSEFLFVSSFDKADLVVAASFSTLSLCRKTSNICNKFLSITSLFVPLPLPPIRSSSSGGWLGAAAVCWSCPPLLCSNCGLIVKALSMNPTVFVLLSGATFTFCFGVRVPFAFLIFDQSYLSAGK
jgi:hypothetical protein